MVDEDRAAYWDAIYARHSFSPPRYDGWLDRHLTRVPPGSAMLELGCGFGANSEHLRGLGYRVTAADLSSRAVERLSARCPGLVTAVVDHARPLPFDDAGFAGVVADLCLHYFTAERTLAILAEIARVLERDGLLFARVNSDEDVAHGAGVGREVEPGYLEEDGHFKRFFDRPMIDRFFALWRVESVRSYTVDRFGPPKQLFEIVARPPIG